MNSVKSAKDHQNPKYKTSLCKYINTAQGCPFKSKCLFAHSEKELRPIATISPHSSAQGYLNSKSKQNYKTTKCKNYEKNGTCRFGERCTFAHGDAEVRKINGHNDEKQTPIDNTTCSSNSNSNDINMTVQQQGFGMLPGKKVRKEEIVGDDVKDGKGENDKTNEIK